ncbi:hypothetical protein HX018_14335, partial [Sphingobacterium hotanense]|nr:hypothetical protein [Sphingobacterium hotanense]
MLTHGLIDKNLFTDENGNNLIGGANPFTLNYQNDTGGKGGAIRATFADMEFFEDTLFNIDDLATSDETSIRCVFYYNNAIEWIGFVTPDFFNVEITDSPLIRLTASDRLGILKDVSYNLSSEIVERISVKDVLSKVLRETGLELNINIVCGIYSDEFPARDATPGFQAYELNDPLANTWINEYRFVTDMESLTTMNCYEILQSILNQFNCFITQYKGEWWIVNKFDLDNSSGVRFMYNHFGIEQYVERIFFFETVVDWINQGSERTLIPAGATNTYQLDNGPEMIYPFNNSLNSNSLSIADIDYWQANTTSTSQTTTSIPLEYNSNGTIKNSYEDVARELSISEYEITTLSNDTTNFASVPNNVIGNSYILESQKFQVVTIDQRQSSFKLNVKGVGKAYTAIMIGLFMEIEKPSQPGLKYYFSLTNPIDQNNNYTGNNEFVLVPNIDAQSFIRVYPFGFENKYNASDVAVNQEWNIEMNIARGQHQEYDITTAKFFFRIYPNRAFKKNNYNAELTSVNNTLKSITLTFLNSTQNPTGTIFQSKLTYGKFTKPTDKRNVLFGDFQTSGQNGYFYKYREDSLSIQYNKDGQRLANWFTKFDAERNPLLIHSLRQLTKSYGTAHDELRLGFDAEMVSPFDRFIIGCQDELNSKYFVLVEGRIDYLRSQFEGVVAQVITGEVVNQEYIYSSFDSDTSRSSGGGISSGGAGSPGGNVTYAESAGHANTATRAATANFASEAQHAVLSDSSNFANEALHATNSDYAVRANTSALADKATLADRATNADHADRATLADRALLADYALDAAHAVEADHALLA